MFKYVLYEHPTFCGTVSPKSIITTKLSLPEVQKRFPKLGIMPTMAFQMVYKYPLEKLTTQRLYI